MRPAGHAATRIRGAAFPPGVTIRRRLRYTQEAEKEQGHIGVPRDEVGRRQARELAERLRGLPLRAVYSSDLRRAHETAETLAAPHGLPVIATAALRERSMGRWEGLRRSPTAASSPRCWTTWAFRRRLGALSSGTAL